MTEVPGAGRTSALCYPAGGEATDDEQTRDGVPGLDPVTEIANAAA